jgi:hypothetical protein
MASLSFKRGVRGFGYWNFSAPANCAEDYCLIEGEKGWIRCSPFWHHHIEGHGIHGPFQYSFTPPENNQIFLIEKVVNFFRGEGENPCPVSQALQTLEWMDSISGKFPGKLKYT